MLISSLASSYWKSSPLSPGNRTSRMRQLGPSEGFLFRKSCVDSNFSARSPTDFTTPSIASRTERSSSMTNTVDRSSDISVLAPKRQRESENRTMRLVRRRPEPPTVGFDDQAADRKAHAHAFRLRRIKRAE